MIMENEKIENTNVEETTENVSEEVKEETKVEETKPLETTAEEKKPEEKKAPKEGKKKKIGLIIGIALAAVAALVVLIVVIIAIVLVLVLHKPTVDLNDYVIIETSGYDGYGRATYSVDGKFMDDYGDKIKFTNKFKKEMKNASSEDLWVLALAGVNTENDADAIELFSTVFFTHGELSQTSGLSNDDVITYSWDFNNVSEEELQEIAGLLGVKIKYSDFDYTVDNLQQVQSFDPFTGVSLVFDGIAPNGTAYIEIADGTDLDYRLDKNTELSNGDTITVTVEPRYGIEDYVNKYGKEPSSDSATFVVEGLGEYVSSASQVPAEELEKMKTQGNEVIQSWTSSSGWKDGYEIEINYIGNYFLTAKSIDNYNKKNKIYMVYKVHYSREVKDYAGKNQMAEFDFYYWVSWSDMYTNSDGIFVYDLNTYDRSNNLERYQWDIYQGKIFGTLYNQVDLLYYGYENLDLLYNKVVTANVEQYQVEENVVDIEPETEETTEE